MHMAKKLTEGAKVRRSFRRSFAQLGRMLPAILVRNWRNVLMPWRMLPYPIALSLIGLVALAMVCTDPEPGTWQEPESIPTSEDTITLTLGDFVGGETPCQEDEIFDHVGRECIHVDRILPAECAGATQLEYEIEGGSPTCATSVPTSTAPVAPAGDAACDDDAPPGHTWQGSMESGYTCVPLDQFEGRSGLITTPKGTVEYHTAPCGDDETTLPPPFGDVILCVDTAAYDAIR